MITLNNASPGIVAIQLSGIFLLCFIFFGITLPSVWDDEGFPAVLEKLVKVKTAKLSAFSEMIEAERGVNRFAGAASATMTFAVLAGLLTSFAVLGPADNKHSVVVQGGGGAPSSTKVSIVILVIGVLFNFIKFLFSWTLVNDVKFGFDYARYFFDKANADDFGIVASACFMMAFTLGASLRIFGHQFVGLYPRFAIKAVPRALMAFLLSYVWFRWFINPLVIQSVSGKLGLITPPPTSSAAAAITPHELDSFASTAAASHTLSLSLGMVVSHVMNDFFDFRSNVGGKTSSNHRILAIRVAVFAFLFLAMTASLSSWFEFASMHGVGFVARHARFAFDEATRTSKIASAIAASSYGVWFTLGMLLNEIASVPAECVRCIDHLAPDLRRVGNVDVLTPEELEAQEHDASVAISPALALASIAFASLLYGADPAYLGANIAKVQQIGSAIANFVPNTWAWFYDNYTKEQLFFLTLPVLLWTEVPLLIFTIADLLKLKRLDKYRMHYAKIDDKRPRLYPTVAELKRCLRHHVENLGLVYAPTFLAGVGGSCLIGYFPYKMTRELPSYWMLEFFVSTLMADQLFYWIHRFAHLKQFYARLHKRHHEWVYSIGMAHHYMEMAEAALFMIPPVLPPFLLGSHLCIVWCTMWFVQISAILGHSAFCVPFLAHLRLPLLDGRHHDLHHLRFNVNYSAVYDFTDKMWGTCRYEPIIYVDGINPELACDHNQVKRALADVRDDTDPWDQDDVKNDAMYVKVGKMDEVNPSQR